MKSREHERLIVWQEAYALTLLVYRLTSEFPSQEKYLLCDQMRRAAISVPSNIAEGNAKESRKDRSRFLQIAKASLEELHCQSRLAHDLDYLRIEHFQKIDSQIHRVSYLLIRLWQSLKSKKIVSS